MFYLTNEFLLWRKTIKWLKINFVKFFKLLIFLFYVGNNKLTFFAFNVKRPTRQDIWKKKLNTNAIAAYNAKALTTGISDKLPIKKHAVSEIVVIKIDGPISLKTCPM